MNNLPMLLSGFQCKTSKGRETDVSIVLLIAVVLSRYGFYMASVI